MSGDDSSCGTGSNERVPGQSHNLARLLSGRLLARNVAWNLFGNGVPLLFALWAVPILIRGMGTARFGLLSIIWMGIGYFSLFDLGTGRALTKLVAERLGDGRDNELPSLIGTGLKLMFALGCLAALVVGAITPWLTESVLTIPPELIHEATWSFWILAATLPFVISTTGLVGVLQAHQRFSTVAAVRIPTGVMSFLGPVLALAITPSLIATTLVLAGSRLSAWVAYRWLSRDVRLGTGSTSRATRAAVREMLSFGGWVTVSNVISPLMDYCDRFAIGAMLTMTAVAYYTTPFDVVRRLSVISWALVSVLFPALTTALTGNPARAELIYFRAARILLVVMLIPLALIMLFAPEALKLWLNPTFARISAPVMRWLAIGLIINSSALLPYALLQGKGRPDLTGKLHLAELPIYAVALWSLVKGYGIVGAAAAWSLRVTIDTAALFALGMKYVSEVRRAQLSAAALTAAAALLLAALALPHTLWLKVCLGSGILGVGSLWLLKDIVSMYRQQGAAVPAVTNARST